MSLPLFQLQEGVRDKNILKAIFVAGSGGAGKSSVADAMFAGWGLKVINQDRHLERFLKDANIPLSQAGSDYGAFKKAQALKGKELRHYAQQRLGLLIDSTGWDYERIAKPAKKLRDLGYDVYMIFVTTSLDTALERNKRRGQEGGRTVPASYVQTAHEGAHRNLPRYVKLFGKSNIWVVNNDQDLPARTWTSVVAPKLRQIGNEIERKPLKNPKGKEWIEKQETQPDLYSPDRPNEWPEPPKPKPLPRPELKTGSDTPSGSPAGRTGKPVASVLGKKGTQVPPKGKKTRLPSFVAPEKQGRATVSFGQKPSMLSKLGKIFRGESIDTVSTLHEGRQDQQLRQQARDAYATMLSEFKRMTPSQIGANVRGGFFTVPIPGSDALLQLVPEQFSTGIGYKSDGTPVLRIAVPARDDEFESKIVDRLVGWFIGKDQTFIHEFTHYLDTVRSGVKGGSARSVDAGDLASYFNNPREYNAYYQETVSEIFYLVDAMTKMERGDEKFRKMFPDFKAFFAYALKKFAQGGKVTQAFYSALTPENQRRLKKRLAQTWDDLQAYARDKGLVN